MVNILKLASCLLLVSMVSSLGCPGVCNKGAVSKREGYCSSLPSNICGHKCSCSDDAHIQDGYYCECRSCQLKSDCNALFNAGNTFSGIYRIAPGGNLMDVYCDMNATHPSSSWKRGGWAVIQRRVDGSTNFFRNWASYKSGFGNLQNELWLGNENIHLLTANGVNELWIEMTDYAGFTKEARYTSFSVGNEASKYKLTVSGYSGNAVDQFATHNGFKFTTFDSDNDVYAGNCAQSFKGGWWYGACHHSNLNGKYFFGGSNPYAQGIHWHAFTGHHDSLKSVVIKIR